VRRTLAALRIPILNLLLAWSAGAQTRMAVVEVRAEDGAGPEVVSAVASALAKHLRQAGKTTMSSTDLAARLKAHKELRGCTRTECLDKTAALADVERLVGGTARREGGGLAVEVWVYDPVTHGSTTGKGACKACGAEKADELVAAALTEALERDARRFVPATVVVSSQPGGATVRLDGRASGLTPLRLRVPAGSHGLLLAKEGYVGQSRDFDAEGGQTLDMHFALQAEAAPERLWPGYKWIALGGAIVAAGVGGVLIAIDGSEVARVDDPIRERRDIRDTKTVGIITLGVGVALGATTGALWWFE